MKKQSRELTKPDAAVVGDLLADLPADLPAASPATPVKPVTSRALERIERVVAVREAREQGIDQHIGYMARPFILCGLPFKKPGKNVTEYTRRNGDEVFEIHGSAKHGLPFGMDFEVLIWVSTLAKKAMLQNGGKCPRVLEFASGAEFLRAFNLPLDGASYRRAQERFLRVFYSTFFFGRKTEHRTRMFRVHFFDEIDLWFEEFHEIAHSQLLPGFTNRIVLSEKFAADLERTLLPIELDTVIAWANNPSQAYFILWLWYRCYTARGGEKIPLMGPGGLKEQCGFDGYEGKRGARNFRMKVAGLLKNAKLSWPECPVKLVTDDPTRPDYLLIARRAAAIKEKAPQRIS